MLISTPVLPCIPSSVPAMICLANQAGVRPGQVCMQTQVYVLPIAQHYSTYETHCYHEPSPSSSQFPLGRGYFVRSFLDNFEWGYGFTKPFCILGVDYETQKRTIKDFGEWYADLIKNQAVRD